MKLQTRIPWIMGITIFIGLIVFSLLSIILYFFFKGFDPTPYIATISTLSIAMLTVVYVLTTFGQLRVMQKQLAEMETARRLESQPLPAVAITKAEIEPPRLFYSPPEEKHSFQSRLHVFFSVKNHSSFPAVNITASAALVFGKKEEADRLRCASERIDVLAAGQVCPAESDHKPDFMFSDNQQGNKWGRFYLSETVKLEINRTVPLKYH